MRHNSKIQVGSIVVVNSRRLGRQLWNFPVYLYREDIVGIVLKRDACGSIFVRLFNSKHRESLVGRGRMGFRSAVSPLGVLKLELIDVSFVV